MARATARARVAAPRGGKGGHEEVPRLQQGLAHRPVPCRECPLLERPPALAEPRHCREGTGAGRLVGGGHARQQELCGT